MRQLVVTQNITLDGVIDMTEDWITISGQVDADSAEQSAVLRDQAAASGAFLAGRQTFVDMRGYWPLVQDDETGVTAHLNQVEKYVVSTTMTDPQWQHSTVLRDLDDVAALREGEGGDIVVTGSISLVHQLIAADLVDEYRLFFYPAVVGRGRRLFEGTTTAPPLRRLDTRAFANGVVLSTYRVAR